jgi:flagellar biosynthetic protein FliO
MNEAFVTTRAIVSLIAVIGLLAAFVWALRRGTLTLTRINPRGNMVIETAMSLGERRSLAIVRVDGRRLLIGLTPSQVSMLTDLPAAALAPDHAPAEGAP